MSRLSEPPSIERGYSRVLGIEGIARGTHELFVQAMTDVTTYPVAPDGAPCPGPHVERNGCDNTPGLRLAHNTKELRVG